MPSPTVTITGTLLDGSGAANAGTIHFTLVNYGNTPPIITGSAVLADILTTVQAAANGTFSVALWGNHQITPAGTFYQVEIDAADGSQVVVAAYRYLADGTYNLASTSPMVTAVTLAPFTPIVANPLGAQTIAGDLTVNELTTLTGVTTPNVNNIRYANDFPGSDACAKINAAIADAPAGGIVDARGFSGATQNCTTTITINKAITLDMSGTTFVSTALPAINITASGVIIKGNRDTTTFTLSPAASSTTPAIQADFSAGAQADGLTITGMWFKGGDGTYTNVARRVILVKNIKNVHIDGNRFSGFDVPVGSSNDLWLVNFGDKSTQFSANYNSMEFPQAAEATNTAFRVGILASSPMVDGYNGLVAGTSPLPQTVTKGEIAGNLVTNGTHAIDLQNAAQIDIHDNTLISQGHRNIILYATNDSVQIHDNYGYNAGSTNLLGDFGNTNLRIENNTFDTTRGGEGRNIELYLSNNDIVISGNILLNAWTDSIYIGHAAQRLTIVGNYIKGFSTGSTNYAGIRIEGEQSAGYTDIAAGGLIDSVVIRNNTIIDLLGGARYGIIILGLQPGSTQAATNITNVTIDTNEVVGGLYNIFLKKNGTSATTWTPTIGRWNNLRGASADQVFCDYAGTIGEIEYLYGTRTDDANYERLFIQAAVGTMNIGTQKAGTGTARGMRLSPASGILFITDSSGADKWVFNGALFGSNVDGACNIGGSAANRINDVNATGKGTFVSGAGVGGLIVTGSSTLPAGTGSNLYMTGNIGSPVVGRIYVGDGTGWRLEFAKRHSSTDTVLGSIDDTGKASFNGGTVTPRVQTSLNALPAATGTVSLDASLGSVFTVTPTGTITLNATNCVNGQVIQLIVTTSGGSSFNITPTTNFISTGALATGTSSGKTFVVTFICNGTTAIEVSRTAAM